MDAVILDRMDGKVSHRTNSDTAGSFLFWCSEQDILYHGLLSILVILGIYIGIFNMI